MHRLPTTVFLDRDGVINRKPRDGDYVKRWEEFEFLPGAVQALKVLAGAGIRVVVVTNQRGVALGVMAISAVEAMHRRMQEDLASMGAQCAAVMVCPHEVDTCDCRKPGVGLFRQAQTLMPEIDFANSVVIGDKATDLLAGAALGCPSYLVGDEADAARIMAEHPGLIEGWAPSLLDVVTGGLGLAPTGKNPTV